MKAQPELVTAMSGNPHRLAALLPIYVALTLAGCGGDEMQQLPAEPTSFLAQKIDGFGIQVSTRDAQALYAAYDILEPAYGKLRAGARQLPANVPPSAVAAELRNRLEPDGWTRVPELARWSYPRSYAFGWVRHGAIYVIVGLDHSSANGTSSPVNILNNMPGSTDFIERPDG